MTEREAHDTIWISALRAAAGVAQKASSGEGDVLRAVSEEFNRIDLRGAVALLDDDGQLVVQSPSLSTSVMRHLIRISGSSIAGYRFDPDTVDLYREVIQGKQALHSTNRASVVGQMIPSALGPLHGQIMKVLGDQPLILAPLLLEGSVIGTLNVVASWLTPADIPMVSALADHIAIALGQVRARSELERTLELQRLRNLVAEAVASELSTDEVFQRVLEIAMETLAADAAVIGFFSPASGVISYPCLIGLPELAASDERNSDGFIQQLAHDQQPILCDDYSELPGSKQTWIEAGVRGFLAVPLMLGERVIGGLGLFRHSTRSTFQSSQIEQAAAIASMAAIAVRNASLFSEAQKRAEESQTLIQTALSISSSLDADTVLHEIARHANNLLNGDGSRIHLLDSEAGVLRCAVALEPNARAILGFDLPLGQGLTGHVVSSGEPLIINDPVQDERGIQVPGTPEDEEECLAIVPLSVRQRTMGAMTVRRLGLDNPFSDAELDLLRAFAAQAAVSIENAHLYGQIEAQAQRLERLVEERTAELELSEARYRSLVETAQSGIFHIGLDGRFIYVNSTLARMAEVTPESMIGVHFKDTAFLTKQNVQNLVARFQGRVSGDRPPSEVFEAKFISSSGREIPALVGVSLIVDEQGNPQGVTGVITDISDRITLEEELEAERDRLDAMLAHIGDAVMVTDDQGLIQFVNPAWERLNGYKASDVMGKSPVFLGTDEQDAAFYEEMKTTIFAGEVFKGDVVNMRKEGTTYEAALTVTPIVSAEGSVVSFVSVYHDISALKELDRLKSQFVSDVSHELRTPLTNIRLYLDLLKRVEDKQKIASYLATLSRESERLANLIEDLLSLSRLDVDATPLSTRQVDINDLLASLAKDRASLASERQLDLELEIDPNLPMIEGDERLLGQIFTNLLTNAMNYTPAGGKIALRSRTQHEGQKRWVIAEVQDSGLGIPKDEQLEIFKRFFRGTASRETGAPGTGLGLAICNNIAERHGGHIHLYSEGIPGRGSCFAVWLPIECPRTPPAPGLI
jgi:PAS domain S-box-containing protein